MAPDGDRYRSSRPRADSRHRSRSRERDGRRREDSRRSRSRDGRRESRDRRGGRDTRDSRSHRNSRERDGFRDRGGDRDRDRDRDAGRNGARNGDSNRNGHSRTDAGRRSRGGGARHMRGKFLEKDEVDQLFIQAIKEVCEAGRRFPLNASIVNDRMQRINRDYSVANSAYSRFGELLHAIGEKGVIKIDRQQDSLRITSCKYARYSDANASATNATKAHRVYLSFPSLANPELVRRIAERIEEKEYGKVLNPPEAEGVSVDGEPSEGVKVKGETSEDGRRRGSQDEDGDASETREEEDRHGAVGEDPELAHSRTQLDKMKAADLMVLDLTLPSHEVGYDFCFWASRRKKSSLCLFDASSGRNLSSKIKGDGRGHIVEYQDIDGAVAALDDYFATVVNPVTQQDQQGQQQGRRRSKADRGEEEDSAEQEEDSDRRERGRKSEDHDEENEQSDRRNRSRSRSRSDGSVMQASNEDT